MWNEPKPPDNTHYIHQRQRNEPYFTKNRPVPIFGRFGLKTR